MIGIIGSRDFPFEIFNSKIDEVFNMCYKLNKHHNYFPDEYKKQIVTGGAIGVDSWVEAYCQDMDIKCKIILCLKPEIKSYYLHRNAEIVAISDYLISFWNGKSRGTKFTMDYMAMRGKPVLRIDTKGKEYWYGEVI